MKCRHLDDGKCRVPEVIDIIQILRDVYDRSEKARFSHGICQIKGERAYPGPRRPRSASIAEVGLRIRCVCGDASGRPSLPCIVVTRDCAVLLPAYRGEVDAGGERKHLDMKRPIEPVHGS